MFPLQHSYLEVVNQGQIEVGHEVDLCVPTGNFGNILSAVYAKKMGLPFKNLISASNSNNVLHDFLSTGVYDLRGRDLIRTSSPAIDILVSSNLERLLWLQLGPHRTSLLMKELSEKFRFELTLDELYKIRSSCGFSSAWASESEVKETMRRVWRENGGYMPDPHTAVALKAAQDFRQKNGNNVRPMIVMGTAHYSKFKEECEDVFDEISDDAILAPAPHQEIERCKTKEVAQTEIVEAVYDDVCSVLFRFLCSYFEENKKR